jgi:mannose-1-phosphate guanylyltransferase
MKAFLLAAGHGTRLRPLTDSVPKCLLPIRGVPMLQIWLDLCQRHGIDEALINIHAHADTVRAFLRENTNDVKVHVSEEQCLLGSAGTLLANRGWIGADSEFWVFYADVLTCVNLRPMIDIHQMHKGVATLGVSEVPDPRRCGIVTLDPTGIVREFVEKPESPKSSLAFSGIMLAESTLFDFIPDRVPADIGFDVLPNLAGRMAAFRISDYLIDMGTPENYLKAQSSWPGLDSLRVVGTATC